MPDIEVATDMPPGIYDTPEDQYHAHPALSVSSARKLLPPSCPAIFHHERRAGQKRRREFDFGHAAHLAVLGAGPELHVIGASDYKTKKAQQERAAAHASGAVPVLAAEFDAVQAMAAALRAHPLASALFAEGGLAEQSLFWTDPDTKVPCRARLDWLSHRVVDYKTTTSAHPDHIAKAADNFGYHMQAAWYLDGARHLDLVAADAEFLFVFQDKDPPYLVTVAELDADAVQIGRERNQFAREIFRDCTEADVWPAYSNDIERISLPAYARRRHYEGNFR